MCWSNVVIWKCSNGWLSLSVNDGASSCWPSIIQWFQSHFTHSTNHCAGKDSMYWINDTFHLVWYGLNKKVTCIMMHIFSISILPSSALNSLITFKIFKKLFFFSQKLSSQLFSKCWNNSSVTWFQWIECAAFMFSSHYKTHVNGFLDQYSF